MFVICYEPQYDDDTSDKEEEVDFSVLKQRITHYKPFSQKKERKKAWRPKPNEQMV